tara:strand:+ start:1392 stop:2003 length:612 start_codon:yes stop_codon:yes gene_type:complete
MRHNNKTKSLGRLTGHRKAMLANMACSLIEHKRITTTIAKGKVLRRYIEPLLTKSKSDTTHSRRVVFSYLQDKEAITELFGNVASQIADRPGGYTRVIKTGFRVGDAADMCMIELVDFNEIYGKEEKKKTRRARRGGAKKEATSTAEAGTVEDAVVVEEIAPETKVEEKSTDVKEEKKPVADIAKEPKAEAKDGEDKKEKGKE